MTLQQIADRLARIAMSYCDLDGPDMEDINNAHARHDLATLTGKFMAELRPHLPKLKVPKQSRFTRTCSLPGCDKPILTKNRSGICTHCWNNRPDEVAVIWAYQSSKVPSTTG